VKIASASENEEEKVIGVIYGYNNKVAGEAENWRLERLAEEEGVTKGNKEDSFRDFY
jgi:hypothetical protein